MIKNIGNIEKKVLDFCRSYNNIYLYGAGAYGETFYYYLKKNGIEISGFISTNGGEEKLGKRVYKADRLLPTLDKKSGIILSLREELQKEIIDTQTFYCDVCIPSDAEISLLDVATAIDVDFFSVKKKKYESKKILIVQLEITFGDMIWSTAFLRELKRCYPNYVIDYVINEKFISLYKKCPYIDKIYTYDCSILNNHISEEMVTKVKAFIERIEGMYAMAFLPRLLPLSWSDAWENILIPVHLGIPQIYGHGLYFLEDQRFRSDFFNDILTGIAKHKLPNHEVMHDLEMISLIGGKIESNRMELWPTHEPEIVKDDTIKICVALVGSIPSRSWSPDKYGDVFNKILEKYDNLKIILCGGNDAVDAANVVMEKTRGRCINLTGKTTLDDAVSVFSGCDIYLGSDTGLMHVASAFNLYVIEISASNKTSPKHWGCTPTRTGPWCDNYSVLQPDKPLDNCKYMCFKPFAHCINQVSEDDVIRELEKAIEIVKKGEAWG